MKNEIISKTTSGVPLLAAAFAVDVVQVVLLVLGCLSALVSFLYTSWIWYNKVKEKGIQAEDLKYLEKVINDTKEKIKNETY